jgi:hypothetical protein
VSAVAITVAALLVGGALATMVGAVLMDVADGVAYVLTRGGIAAFVAGVVIAVVRAVTT